MLSPGYPSAAAGKDDLALLSIAMPNETAYKVVRPLHYFECDRHFATVLVVVILCCPQSSDTV